MCSDGGKGEWERKDNVLWMGRGAAAAKEPSFGSELLCC